VTSSLAKRVLSVSLVRSVSKWEVPIIKLTSQRLWSFWPFSCQILKCNRSILCQKKPTRWCLINKFWMSSSHQLRTTSILFKTLLKCVRIMKSLAKRSLKSFCHRLVQQVLTPRSLNTLRCSRNSSKSMIISNFIVCNGYSVSDRLSQSNSIEQIKLNMVLNSLALLMKRHTIM